jgi:hypothetical protein
VKPVTRDEILDYQTYGDRRDTIRKEVMAVKERRRIHAGPVLTFLFENRDTVRYQVQEMMRAEQIVREDGIHHELETYNELLGGPGELGCTLLVEIDDKAEREAKLSRWTDLVRHLYVGLEDGGRVYARWDERQVDDGKLSSVQFLRFDCKGRVPVAVGSDFADLTVEQKLTPDQRAALRSDLEA